MQRQQVSHLQDESLVALSSIALFVIKSQPDQHSNTGSANRVSLGVELSVHQPIKDRRRSFQETCLKTVIIYDSSSTEITNFTFNEADNSKLLKLVKIPLAQISVHKQSKSGTVLVALKA